MNTLVQYFGFFFIFVTLYFEIFLVLSLFDKPGEKKAKKSLGNPLKSVTILVPVYNEEGTLKNTIESILDLDYPRDKIHIIIINDGSTDSTEHVMAGFAGMENFTILHKPNGGKHTALNMGLDHVKTEIVGCLDADSFVYPDALKHIMNRFQDPETMAVTPSMIVWKPSKFIQKMQKAEYYYGNFLRNALSKLGALYVTAGPFSFFRMDVFGKIGRYRHAHSTEDMEIAMRMQKNHMKIAYAGDAVVYTSSPDTLRKLYKQRVRWVSGFFGNLIDYRAMMFNKKYGDLGVFILPFSLTGILLVIPFVLISVFQFFRSVVRYFVVVSSGGWDAMFRGSGFDPFFIDTSVTNIMSLLLLGLLILFIAWGKRITHGEWQWNFDFFFMLLYTFIAPFWLLKAIYNNLFKKKVVWR